MGVNILLFDNMKTKVKKKWIVALTISILSIIIFAGCTNSSNTEKANSDNGRFKAIYYQNYFDSGAASITIIKDTKTQKQYLYMETGHGIALQELK